MKVVFKIIMALFSAVGGFVFMFCAWTGFGLITACDSQKDRDAMFSFAERGWSGKKIAFLPKESDS